ncbi:MAG: hypothetical protein K2J15_07040 [Muribaculaceae bacterium]|nr:hypothetical protein [Muribaculaceae bacterium]
MNKFLLSSLVAAAAAVPAVAGVNNLNYQAVIKDGNGVVANKEVALKFELLDNAKAVVYTEDQTAKSNAAGLVVCQLGNEDALSTIEWGDLSLRVSVNLGNGFQVISTEPVSSVPTALYALRSADSDEIKAAVEELLIDNETNKETIYGVNAEIVKLNGVADEFSEFMEESYPIIAESLANLTTQADENYDDLKGSIERNVTNITVLQGKVGDIEEEVARLVEEGETNATTLRGVSADLTYLQGVAEDYNEFKEESYPIIAESLANLTTQADENYDDLKGSIERNVTNITVLQGKVGDLEEEVTRLVQEGEENAATLRGMNADITKFNGVADEFAEFMDNDYSKIAESLANLTSQADQNFDELKGYTDRNANNITELQSKATELADDVQVNTEAIANLEELTGENGRLMSLIITLQNQVAELTQKVAALEAK